MFSFKYLCNRNYHSKCITYFVYRVRLKGTNKYDKGILPNIDDFLSEQVC